MRYVLAVCLGFAATLGPVAQAADLPQNCWDPVFQDCKSSSANENLFICELDLGLVQQGPNTTHVYGCETRLTAMSAIVVIEVTALRNHGGLALYGFKFNKSIEGRSQLTFEFGRPIDQTEPLAPRAFVTVVGVR